MLTDLLFPQKRASLENPNLSLSDPESWASIFGETIGSDSGVTVSHDTALGFAPVWQAVSMISGDIAKLPLEIHRYTDRERNITEVDYNHPAYRIVRRKPNRENPAFRFWRRFMVHALLWGNAYAWIDRAGNGKPIGLYNLLPDRTTPHRQGGKLYYVTETTNPDGSPWLRPIPDNDVLRISGVSVDTLSGCDIVQSARNAFGLGLAAQKFASRFFKNGARPSGILEIPVTASQKFAKNLEEGFSRKYTGEDGWFKTVILRDGAKFHTTSVAPNEGQMTETRTEQARDVARYYNLSPAKLGIDGSTSYNSKSESNRDYLDSTLSAWLCEIAGECDCKLLSSTEQNQDSLYFEHDVYSLLRMNPKEQAATDAIDIRNAIRSPNEVRARRNLPSYDGGDEFLPLAKAQSPGGADKGANDKARGPGMGKNSSNDPAFMRSIFDLTAKARVKAKSGRAFEEWVENTARSCNDEVISGYVARYAGLLDGPASELKESVENLSLEIESEIVQ